MSKFLDALGTSMQSFQVGIRQAGAKSINFVNNVTGTLTWNPTANRTLTLPDKTDTLAGLTDVQTATGATVGTLSANYTLGINDGNTLFIGSNTGSITVTVPTNATTAIPIGAEVGLSPDSTGSITIVGQNDGTNTAIINRYGTTITTGHVIADNYAPVVLKKVAANSWRLYGGAVQFSSIVPKSDFSGYVSGRYWVAGAWNNATTSVVLTTNTVIFIPFAVHRPITVDSLSVNVNTAVASTSVRLGIYTGNLSNGQPQTLVIDAGTVATTATGAATSSAISQALSTGVYHFAIAASGAPNLTGVAASPLSADGYGVAAVGTTWQLSYRVPFTFGALPTTATTGTQTYLTSQPLGYYLIN